MGRKVHHGGRHRWAAPGPDTGGSHGRHCEPKYATVGPATEYFRTADPGDRTAAPAALPVRARPTVTESVTTGPQSDSDFSD